MAEHIDSVYLSVRHPKRRSLGLSTSGPSFDKTQLAFGSSTLPSHLPPDTGLRQLSVAARPAVPGSICGAENFYSSEYTRFGSSNQLLFFLTINFVSIGASRAEIAALPPQARTARPSGPTAQATPPPPPPHAPLRLRLRQFKSEKQETLHLRSDIQSLVVSSVD